MVSVYQRIAAGVAIMGVFAANVLPVWCQAVLFVAGCAYALLGGVRATWDRRFGWGKTVIGLTVLVIVGALIVLSGIAIIAMGAIGINGAFKSKATTIVEQQPMNHRSLTDAFVEAFDIIRRKEPDPKPIEIQAQPRPKRAPRKVAPKVRRISTSRSPALDTVAIGTPAVQLQSIPVPETVSGADQPIPPPRNLSAEQKRVLFSRLSPLSGSVLHSFLRVPNGIPEAYGYQQEIYAVFQRAGLKPDTEIRNIESPNDTGVIIEQGANTDNTLVKSVQQAFHDAGIVTRIRKRNEVLPDGLVISIGPQPL
jgi:hypothetical protein